MDGAGGVGGVGVVRRPADDLAANRILVLAVLLALLAALLPALQAGGTAGVGLPTLGVTWESGARTGDAVPVGAAVDPALRGATGDVDVIVQAAGAAAVEAARTAVEAAGGVIAEDLAMVDGFRATVPAAGIEQLAGDASVRAISANHQVRFEEYEYDDSTSASNFVRTSGARAGWNAGLLGRGVGVAVIDTGVSPMQDFDGRLVHGPDLSGEGSYIDTYGHGTVMAGLVGGSGSDSMGRPGGAYTGVAPESWLISVKAAGRNGAADVSTLLQAMHWVSAYQDQFNIRVLNLSWGTRSTQHHSVDPLNYAVQRLWQQGIVVVTAAGNSGPHRGTITKPADDPMVLTVGAFDDKHNFDLGDDNVPGWSSRGPTAHGVAKPDVIAPGRTLVSARSFGSFVEAENPKAHISPSYIRGSGTSQAAAVTSGLVALLLEARPELTPDEVKAIFTATANPISGTNVDAQGAGRVDLAAALAAPVPADATQTPTASGLGSIDESRGGRYVETDCNGDGTPEIIFGEIDIRCEPWNGSSWTGSSWTGSSWTGSSWTGSSWTGSSWTGSSWTGSSWTGSSWTGSSWTGSSWTGESWQGSSWTGSSWTGSSWTGSSWTGSSWTGSSWTGSSWTGSSWTTAEYEEDLFLTGWWGLCPESDAVAATVAQTERLCNILLRLRESGPSARSLAL